MNYLQSLPPESLSPESLPADLATPALVVDLPTAERNIARLAEYGKAHKLAIRPHTKTHKSLFMARRQMAQGAVGLTTAKLGEAQIMARAGDDILVGYPALDPARTARAAELARQHTLRVAVDSAFAADALGAAARAAGSTIGILVDIDVHFHRTGLQTPEQALGLAQHVARTPGLRLDGMFCFPGHIVDQADQQRANLKAVADLLEQTLELWQRHGLEAKIVSGGSTPTAFQSHLVKAYTEIRPGTYIYYDRNCITRQWCSVADSAARLICTVISDAVPDKCVLDGGSKSFTSDMCTGRKEMGFGLLPDYPQANVVRLSEEHAEVDLSQCAQRPKVGQRVQVIPNHICPVVNLHDQFWLRDGGGAWERMPVDARGKVS